MKKIILLALLVAVCTIQYSCDNGSEMNGENDSPEIDKIVEKDAAALKKPSDTLSTTGNKAIVSCPGSCNLPANCTTSEEACNDPACWIPVACCHQIEEAVFTEMRRNPTVDEPTIRSRKQIEDLLQPCKDVDIRDNTENSDDDMTIESVEKLVNVCYSYAVFKGILALNPKARTFYFYNALRAGEKDIAFKVVFESGPTRYYDLSEAPPCK